MKYIIFITILLLFGCSDGLEEKNKELAKNLSEMIEENESITKELNETKTKLAAYVKLFDEKRVPVLMEGDIERCKAMAAELFVKDNRSKKPESKLYYKITTSIAKSCSTLDFDIDIIYGKKNVLKGIKRNPGTQAFELFLAAQETLKSVNPSNYDVIVCLDVIMSAYSRYNKEASSHQIKKSLDMWIQKTGQLGKSLSISQSLQIGAMMVYFEILGQ